MPSLRKLALTSKPEACKACPWYGDGTGFAPDELNTGATVLFMGARPDEQAEVSGVPFTGRTGKMIEANIGKYGLGRKDASWANVTRCRYNHSNDKPDNYYNAALYCGNVFSHPDLTGYRVIVPLDDEALMLCAGLNDVEVWRGSPIIPDSGLAAGKLTIPTPHPSIIFQKPRLRSASKGDFGRICRAAKLGAGAFEYQDEFWQACEAEIFMDRLSSLAADASSTVVLDVETNKAKPIDARLRILGIGWAKDRAANVAWEALSEEQIGRIRAAVAGAKCRFVTATPFDYTVLTKADFTFPWERCHDLTLLHSRFDIELPHTLAFIASTWTYRKFWKWLSDSEPYYYNCLDCAGEWEAFNKLESHCRAHAPEVWACYERDRTQIRTACAVHLAGMPLNREQFRVERRLYSVLRDDLEATLLKEFEKPALEAPPPCEKHKRYSGRTGLKLRKSESESCSFCLAIRRHYQDSQPLKLRSHRQMMKLLESEGKKIPLGKRRDAQHHKKKSMDKAAIKKMATTYSDQRLFKLLEFRAHDKVATTYFKEAKVSPETGRVHGVFSMHGAMHRWHCTDPNQQQVLKPQKLVITEGSAKTPVEERQRLESLVAGLDVNLEEPHGPRRAYVAGPDRVFLSFDADGLHYRIAGVLSGDPFIRETLERYDREAKPEFKPHIVNCCALFKVDTAQAIHWMHEEAPQYTFSKNFIYMILNWGDTGALYQAAVSAKLDLDIGEVGKLKDNWLTQAHYYRDWRESLIRQAESSGMVTLFDGRRRRYYGLRWKDGTWHADVDTLKEIGNHPLIGTEVSYVNPRLEKVLDYVEANPPWQLVLLSHDGFMLEGPHSQAPQAVECLMPMLQEPFPCGPGKVLKVPWAAKTGKCWALLDEL